MAEPPSDDTSEEPSSGNANETVKHTQLGDEVWSIETSGNNPNSQSTTETDSDKNEDTESNTTPHRETESQIDESIDESVSSDEFTVSRGSQTQSSAAGQTSRSSTEKETTEFESPDEQPGTDNPTTETQYQSNSPSTEQQSPAAEAGTDQTESTPTQYWKPAALALTVATLALGAVLLTLGFFITSRSPPILILLSLFLVAWATARVLGVYYIHKDGQRLRRHDTGYTPRRFIWTTGFFLSPPLVTYGLLTVYLYRRTITN